MIMAQRAPNDQVGRRRHESALTSDPKSQSQQQKQNAPQSKRHQSLQQEKFLNERDNIRRKISASSFSYPSALQNDQTPSNTINAEGKRTLIKNQLYLIEQLQLENADLRNDRDQLQLENEELKFQLQMISSSNILTQPKSTFEQGRSELAAAAAAAAAAATATSTPTVATAQLVSVDNSDRTESLEKTLPMKQIQLRCTQQPQVAEVTDSNSLTSAAASTKQQLVRSAQLEPLESVAQLTIAPADTSLISGNKSLSGKSTSLAPFSAVITSVSPRTPISVASTLSSSPPSSSATVSGDAATSSAARTNVQQHQLANNGNPAVDDISAINNGGAPSSSSSDDGDDSEHQQLQRAKLVEQRYASADSTTEQVQAAAIIIQRAFRKHQICKRFRTITEQLRHTCQSLGSDVLSPPNATSVPVVSDDTELRQQSNFTAPTNATSLRPGSVSYKTTAHQEVSQSSGAPSKTAVASSSARAAAWESLSYATSKLIAATAASVARKDEHPSVTMPPPSGASTEVKNSTPVHPTPPANQAFKTVALPNVNNGNVAVTSDSVMAAAINFQQLESLRKRQYRVALNIFNKNPEKGVSFLIAHSFIDASPPYAKASSGFYHSNQLHHHHFMSMDDVKRQPHPLQPAKKQTKTIAHQLVAKQLQQPVTPPLPACCPICVEEDNLKRNVAHFLLHRKGLAKEKIGQYLGNLQVKFNQDVLGYYLAELDFNGMEIDLALRKFLTTFRLPGEAQKIERIVDCFAQRYVQCQVAQSSLQQPLQKQSELAKQQSFIPTANNFDLRQQIDAHHGTPTSNNDLILLTKDEIFILTFAIIMLNTDLHSPSLKPTSRMSAQQFVNNLRGVFQSQNVHESNLIEIYERVKANQISTTPDHVAHVMKVQQGLTVTNFQRKELPNLCVPHRRLVCFCRLFEVYDTNKKERQGQHQREIFLFNDLLLVTKLAKRVRANTSQVYNFRQGIALQGLYVQLFQNSYYAFGIKLCRRSNDEAVIMFNARNELDQSRFADDLSESMAEMDEMAAIKAHNVVDAIHTRHVERLRRHAMMHSEMAADSVGQNDGKLAGSPAIARTSADGNKGDSQKYEKISAKSSATAIAEPILVGHCDIRVSTAADSVALKKGLSTNARCASMLNLSTGDTGRSVAAVSGAGASSASHRLANGGGDLAARRAPEKAPQDGRIATTAASTTASTSTKTSHLQQPWRCSAGSVHSLDSGLYSSRDVSPNQSS